MFKDVKVGDRLYDIVNGYCKVSWISSDRNQFKVSFEKRSLGNLECYYCIDGTYGRLNQDNATIYWDKPEIIAPKKPKRKVIRYKVLFKAGNGDMIITSGYYKDRNDYYGGGVISAPPFMQILESTAKEFEE